MPCRVAVCLVLLAAALAAPAQAAFPGQNGRISFSSEGDLWSVNPDGSNLVRLTRTPLPDDEAQSAFSPGGTRIAYRRRPAAGVPFQVFVMNADGTDPRQVTTDASVNATQPGWSPDGTQLVYRRSTPGQNASGDVWAIGVDGTGARALVTTPVGDERYPVLSPDGTRLAFTSSREGGQFDIFVGGAEGSGQTRLTTDPGYDSAPSWSPDATRLAFERGARLDDEPTKDVWVMDADGTDQAVLAATPGVVDEGPAFSPDGTQIAFTTGRDGNGEIYRMAADGSSPTPVLVRAATKEESPDWQSLPLPGVAPAAAGPGASVPAVPGLPSTTTSSPRPALVDRDRDGLSAGAERARRTSDLDRDSDDDGLSDDREVRRTRTRPDVRDTDRDRLPDGLELGVRRPVADPPGLVRGTALRRFRADRDPRTRTDPRRRDSDRDGVADGREDRDANGRRDRGESDPRAR